MLIKFEVLYCLQLPVLISLVFEILYHRNLKIGNPPFCFPTLKCGPIEFVMICLALTWRLWPTLESVVGREQTQIPCL